MKIGSKEVKKLYLGKTEITSIFLGTKQIYKNES